MTAKSNPVIPAIPAVPAILAVLTWGAAAVLDVTDTPAAWVLAAGTLTTLVSPLAARGIDSPLSERWFVGLLFAFLTGYLTWTTWTTAFQRNAALPVALAAIVFTAWWRVLRHKAAHRDQAADSEAQRLQKAAEKGDMPAVLAGVGIKGVEGQAVEQLPHGAGTKQHLTLPPNGSVTFRQLHARTEQVMIATRAPFPIRFAQGNHAADVVCIRMAKDVLAEPHPYPVDRAAGKSIHDPIPLGLTELGDEAGVTLRELSGKIVGERGSGKSNTINTILAYLTGCTDALVWMIDGKGGRTARPWLEALDWVACPTEQDSSEADRMLAAAVAVVQARATGDGEKVEPTERQPGIVLVIEESSVVTGVGSTANNRRAELAKQLVVLGRSEAVDLLVVGQRGTVTMLGSGDMASQLQLTIGLGVSKIAEAQRIFEDQALAREIVRYAQDERYKGVMLVKHPQWNSVLPVKGYRLDPALIPGVARSNARFKPSLEVPASLAADKAGGYGTRWERWTAPGTGDSGDVSPVPAGDVPAGDTSDGTRPMSRAEQMGLPESPIIAKLRAERDAKRGQGTGQPEPAVRDMSPEELEAWFKAPAAEGSHVPADEAELVVPPILTTVEAIFGRLEAERLHTREILEYLPGGSEESTRMTGKAFGLLMNRCGVAPLPNDFVRNGERRRGYELADVRRQIAAFRDGKAKPDPAAFDWPDPL